MPHWRTWSAFFLASGQSRGVPRALLDKLISLYMLETQQVVEHLQEPHPHRLLKRLYRISKWNSRGAAVSKGRLINNAEKG